MTLSEADRSVRIQAALAAHDRQQDDTLRLPWRSGIRQFPVIDLELDALLLNPRSHRIRAQLESRDEAEVVRREPWSAEAQAIIAEILRELGENFDELKTNLAEEGQQQHGVITPWGLLVNANRRAVALRDLGKTHMTVAVLPSDTTAEEIDGLELRLQMQKDFREAYTFTNRLLFVDELITRQNMPANDVARALNLAASSDPRAMAKGRAKVEQDTRVLAMIRTVQERSGNRVPLTSFDDQEIALEELDNRLRELGPQDAAAARELYEIRLLGLLSGVPYRDLRELDGEAVEEHVVPIMRDNDVLAQLLEHLPGHRPEEEAGAEPAGLDLLEEDPAEPDGGGPGARAVAAFNDLLATTHGNDVVVVPGADGSRRLDREPLVTAVHDALRAAAQEVRDAGRDEDLLQAPTNRALEAERKLAMASQAYASIAERVDFDDAAFAAALRRVHRRLRDLADESGADLDA